MARYFDTRPNIFSSGGHLDQVEYAMEAVANSGSIIGIRTDTGVLLTAENKHYDQLMDADQVPNKIFKVNDEIMCAITGIASDGMALLDKMRVYAQQFQLRFQRSIPCESLVQHICSHKQASTHFTGSRPYGVSILFVSWHDKFGYELYHSNPSGDYNSWRAVCVGKNFQKVNNMLKERLKCVETLTLCDAQQLVSECLLEVTDTFNPNMIEMSVMERQNDKNVIKILSHEHVKNLFNSMVTVSVIEAQENIEQDKPAEDTEEP